MNIFVLDNEPTKASLYHCDKHIVKMPLETAQMLCTAHHLVGSIAPYKKAHPKHPCTLWVLESIENYRWLCTLGLALCKEYSFRYDKIHKCEEIIQWCASNEPRLPKIPRTPFALAMPIECKTEDSVQSYRNYYIAYKQNLYSWKKREKPEWLLT